MYELLTQKAVAFFSGLREDINRQFITVFVGYFLLSMVSFCVLELIHYPDQSALNFWHKMIMRSTQQASLLVVLFSLIPVRGRIFHLILITLAFPSFLLNVGHFALYDSLVHSGALGALFFASFHEMGGYVKTFGPDVLLLLVPFFIALPVFWRFRFDKIRRRPQILCGVLFFIMASIQVGSALVSAATSHQGFFEKAASHLERRAYESTFFFGNDVKTIYTFGKQYMKLRKSRANMKDANFDVELREEEAPELVVFVLGESLSRHHMPWYDYERNTTPRLMEWSEEEDLLVFEDVISLTNITRLTLMRTLTLATREDRQPFYDGESIVSAANSADYDTYWISNAGMLTPHDAEHTALARQADVTEFVNTDFRLKSLDENLLPAFDEVLERDGDRKFVVLHTLGSHPQYSQRFSEEFDHYDEDDPIPDGYPELTDREREHFNDYDNTIRYTDFFLDEVMTRTKEASDNAVFIYLSDHGQDVFELPEKRMGHAQTVLSNYELESPMFMWASDSYVESNEQIWENLRENQDAPLSTTFFFDTVVDLLRIESDDWEGDKSLAQPDPPEYDRVIMTPDEREDFIYDPDETLYE
ncbi:MAG: sulfatase-like hydrolase/transferase [Persicimonas sp.]